MPFPPFSISRSPRITVKIPSKFCHRSTPERRIKLPLRLPFKLRHNSFLTTSTLLLPQPDFEDLPLQPMPVSPKCKHYCESDCSSKELITAMEYLKETRAFPLNTISCAKTILHSPAYETHPRLGQRQKPESDSYLPPRYNFPGGSIDVDLALINTKDCELRSSEAGTDISSDDAGDRTSRRRKIVPASP